MKRAGLALLLALIPFAAHARPSPYPSVTSFEGDRYSARQAQMAPTRAVQTQRKAKRHRRHYRKPAPGYVARQSAPVVRQIAVAEGMIPAAWHIATGRPAAWCGWWLGHHLGVPFRELWLARNWASVGTRASPAPGVVVVWRHHVGIITGRRGNRWVIKSGNDGHRVRERPRSLAGAIAFRRV
jgi:hypothetical protein